MASSSAPQPNHPSFSGTKVYFMRKPGILGKKESTSLRSSGILEAIRSSIYEENASRLKLTLPSCDVFSVGAVSDLNVAPNFERFLVGKFGSKTFSTCKQREDKAKVKGRSNYKPVRESREESASRDSGLKQKEDEFLIYSLDRIKDIDEESRKALNDKGAALGKAVNLLEAMQLSWADASRPAISWLKETHNAWREARQDGKIEKHVQENSDLYSHREREADTEALSPARRLKQETPLRASSIEHSSAKVRTMAVEDTHEDEENGPYLLIDCQVRFSSLDALLLNAVLSRTFKAAVPFTPLGEETRTCKRCDNVVFSASSTTKSKAVDTTKESEETNATSESESICRQSYFRVFLLVLAPGQEKIGKDARRARYLIELNGRPVQGQKRDVFQLSIRELQQALSCLALESESSNAADYLSSIQLGDLAITCSYQPWDELCFHCRSDLALSFTDQSGQSGRVGLRRRADAGKPEWHLHIAAHLCDMSWDTVDIQHALFSDSSENGMLKQHDIVQPCRWNRVLFQGRDLKRLITKTKEKTAPLSPGSPSSKRGEDKMTDDEGTPVSKHKSSPRRSRKSRSSDSEQSEGRPADSERVQPSIPPVFFVPTSNTVSGQQSQHAAGMAMFSMVQASSAIPSPSLMTSAAMSPSSRRPPPHVATGNGIRSSMSIQFPDSPLRLSGSTATVLSPWMNPALTQMMATFAAVSSTPASPTFKTGTTGSPTCPSSPFPFGEFDAKRDRSQVELKRERESVVHKDHVDARVEESAVPDDDEHGFPTMPTIMASPKRMRIAAARGSNAGLFNAMIARKAPPPLISIKSVSEGSTSVETGGTTGESRTALSSNAGLLVRPTIHSPTSPTSPALSAHMHANHGVSPSLLKQLSAQAINSGGSTSARARATAPDALFAAKNGASERSRIEHSGAQARLLTEEGGKGRFVVERMEVEMGEASHEVSPKGRGEQRDAGKLFYLLHAIESLNGKS